MKKIFVLVVGLAIGLAGMAQNNTPADTPATPRRQRLTPEQKAEFVTNQMVKTYELTPEQAGQLKQLNTRMLSRQRQPRQGAGRPNAPRQLDKQTPSAARGYMSGLKEILTTEQFQTYCTNKAIERQMQGNNNFRGNNKNFRGGNNFRNSRAGHGRHFQGVPGQQCNFNHHGDACSMNSQACTMAKCAKNDCNKCEKNNCNKCEKNDCKKCEKKCCKSCKKELKKMRKMKQQKARKQKRNKN